MSRDNDTLLDAVSQACRAIGHGPHETLLGIEKARRRLGNEPRYSWREAVAG